MTREGDSPIRGLVLAGGESQRMGKPKGALVYHDKPQCQVVAELLDEFCVEVFISIRTSQKDLPWLGAWPVSCDSGESFGPMSGLSSAIERHDDSAWWVVGCDMPLIDRSVLQGLCNHRKVDAEGTAYEANDAKPEPLCTIYEPSAFSLVQQSWKAGKYSLREILKSVNTHVVKPPSVDALKSIDTPTEFSHYMNEKRK